MLNVHVAPTREQALVAGPARPRRVLQVPRPLRPLLQLPVPGRLEGAVRLPAHARGLDAAQKIQVVGSIDDAVDTLGFWRDLLDLEHLCFFFDFPGLSREHIDEQMHLVAEEVFPRLGEPVERRPLPDLAPLG